MCAEPSAGNPGGSPVRPRTEGDLGLEEVIIRDVLTGERRSLGSTALFVLTGDGPEGTAMFETASERGRLRGRDVRSGSVKRVASAVGEGAIAVRQVYEHLVSAGRR